MAVSLAASAAGKNKSYGDALQTVTNEDVGLYKEDYSPWIKFIFILFGTVSVVTSTIAIIILQKTKKIPRSAKFLSMCLLIFDVLYIVSSCVRKFILDPAINLNLQVLAQVFIQWSYLTICLMAIDRVVVFNWPNVYIKHCTTSLLRKVMIIVCLSLLLIFCLLRYLGCYIKHKSTIYLAQAGMCNKIMYVHYCILLFLILLISSVCYYKIFRIVQMKTQPRNQKLSFYSIAKEVSGYKVTAIVLFYLIIIVLTALAFLFILFLRMLGVLDVTQLRWAIEIVAILNSCIDPYLYVMWFRESQMELLKMFCPWNAAIQKQVEDMRIEIFCIVTSEKCSQSADVNTEVV